MLFSHSVFAWIFQKSYSTYFRVQNMAKYNHFSINVVGQRQTDCVLMDKVCFMNSEELNLEV